MSLLNKYIENRLKEDNIAFDEYYYLLHYLHKISLIENVDSLEQPKINLSKKELLELTHDFYKACTPPHIYEAYLNSSKTTRFKTSKISDNSYYGITYSGYITNAIYIKLIKQKNFYDVTTLAHEFAHVISYTLNESYEKFYSPLFDETFSLFISLLSASYHEKTEFRPYALDFEQENLNHYISLFHNNLKKSKLIKKKLDNQINIQDELNELLIHLLASKAREDMPYLAGFLVATNILKIYSLDPEYAFYLLNKVIMYDKPSNNYELFTEFQELNLFETDTIEEYKQSIIRKRGIH